MVFLGDEESLNTLKGMITFESTKGCSWDTFKSLKSQIPSINHPWGFGGDLKVRRIRRNIIAIEDTILSLFVFLLLVQFFYALLFNIDKSAFGTWLSPGPPLVRSWINPEKMKGTHCEGSPVMIQVLELKGLNRNSLLEVVKVKVFGKIALWISFSCLL